MLQRAFFGGGSDVFISLGCIPIRRIVRSCGLPFFYLSCLQKNKPKPKTQKPLVVLKTTCVVKVRAMCPVLHVGSLSHRAGLRG